MTCQSFLEGTTDNLGITFCFHTVQDTVSRDKT